MHKSFTSDATAPVQIWLYTASLFGAPKTTDFWSFSLLAMQD